MKTVTSKDGEMIDEIVWRAYGKQSGFVEKVLDANYRLADNPEELPAGVVISLPSLIINRPIKRLWDD
jgi:phage tail protein X